MQIKLMLCQEVIQVLKKFRVRKFLDLVLRNCQDIYIPYRDLSAKFHRKEE